MCKSVFWPILHVCALIMCCIDTTTSRNYDQTKNQISKLKREYDVLFGISTSAYQIEGAWNESGKTESIWDRFVHTYPEKIIDQSNGDITCDSYHNIKRDVAMLKYLGIKFYRFSISWARIAPTPMRNAFINDDGIEYYHQLIDELIANGIAPMITLYHYDLPQNIQDFGGWTNELIIDYFENYAQIVFKHFAPKVKYWVTFNLPEKICHRHYGTDDWPPEISSSGIADYLCMRNLFLAHATVYRLYKNQHDPDKTGMMGIHLSFEWFESMSNSTEDNDNVERFRKLLYGIQADPIYSTYGDFPELLKSVIANKSREQGFRNSRLPVFTTLEIEYIRNTYDFMGIAYFASHRYSQISDAGYEIPSFEDDLGIYDGGVTLNETNYPEGLKAVLLYIKTVYNNPKVMILENGCSTWNSTLENGECVSYFLDHLNAIYDAVVTEGCNVIGYSAWTLMDSFEWDKGFTEHYGLFQINFDNGTSTIKPKATAKFFKEIFNDTQIDDSTPNPTTPIHEDQLNGSEYLFGTFKCTILLLMICLIFV